MPDLCENDFCWCNVERLIILYNIIESLNQCSEVGLKLRKQVL